MDVFPCREHWAESDWNRSWTETDRAFKFANGWPKSTVNRALVVGGTRVPAYKLKKPKFRSKQGLTIIGERFVL
jgi:hypothetical protein